MLHKTQTIKKWVRAHDNDRQGLHRMMRIMAIMICGWRIFSQTQIMHRIRYGTTADTSCSAYTSSTLLSVMAGVLTLCSLQKHIPNPASNSLSAVCYAKVATTVQLDDATHNYRSISQCPHIWPVAVIRSYSLFKNDYLASSAVERLKMRLVAGGHGQDRRLYEDLSSRTVATSSLLSTKYVIAAAKKRKISATDIADATVCCVHWTRSAQTHRPKNIVS